MNIRQKIKKEDVILIVSAIVVSGVFLSVIFSATLKLSYKNNSNQSAQKITKQAPQNSINQQQSVKKTNQEATTTIAEWGCLEDDEEVKINRERKNLYDDDLTIKITKNRKIKDQFKIINVYSEKIFPCGIYAIREFNPDKINGEYKNYRGELWVYNYEGRGEIFTPLIKANGKNEELYYSFAFSVSPNEKYIVLEKGYRGGKDDYSLVIKNLNTKEDIFVLKLSDIIEKYPKVVGSFGMIDWKEDGRYFWTDIFQGALTPGYVRIDSVDWSWEVFETPEGAMGGFAPNFKTGWMPYVPSAVWTGMVEADEEIRKEARARGQTSTLYLHNIFTKKQFKIYETSIDPIWNYGPPVWLSETELEYKLPGGKKKIYKLKRL